MAWGGGRGGGGEGGGGGGVGWLRMLIAEEAALLLWPGVGRTETGKRGTGTGRGQGRRDFTVIFSGILYRVISAALF